MDEFIRWGSEVVGVAELGDWETGGLGDWDIYKLIKGAMMP
jgi:hypothetical protein